MKTLLALAIAISLHSNYNAVAVDIVVSRDLANTEGNVALTGPFDTGVNSTRMQQVYNASEFSSLLPQGGWVTGIWFRADASPGGGGHAFSTTLANVQINLSTTARSADGLSLNFADNVGPNDTVVVGSGPLTLDTPYLFATHPQPFLVGIALQNRFFYNPAAGNLLLDVRNFSGGSIGPLDAALVTGDSVSRIFALSVGANTGIADTIGLVTRFNVFPVPEPSTWALLALGLAALVFHRRRLKQPKGATRVTH